MIIEVVVDGGMKTEKEKSKKKKYQEEKEQLVSIEKKGKTG